MDTVLDWRSAAEKFKQKPSVIRLFYTHIILPVLFTMLMTRPSPPATSSTASEPRSAAGRLAVAALWGFSVVIIATYAANMAALITAARLPASSANPAESSVSAGGGGGDSVLRRTLLSDVRSGRLRLITAASGAHDVRALLFSGGGGGGDDVTDDVTELVDDVQDGIRSAGERSDCAFVGDSEVLWYHLRSAADHPAVDTVVLHATPVFTAVEHCRCPSLGNRLPSRIW